MTTFQHVLVLLLLMTALGVVARWVPWPSPITYVLGGIACGLVPAFPTVKLDPEFFFLCFLPPLLFADGWLMPLREFGKAKGPILLLATALVVFTTLGVGLAAAWLIPSLPLAMGFALGAVVSPTDAVAINAITERLKVPVRLRIMLNGESLMNDATGLVAFRFAIAALLAGKVSVGRIALEFVLVAGGGLILGLVVAYLVGRLRDLLRRTGNADPITETTLSLLTPYAAYLVAHSAQASGILGVVAAGLYSGWRDPIRMDVETRQTAWAIWVAFLYWLNGLAFVLLGLQLPGLFTTVTAQYPMMIVIGVMFAIAGATILLRIVGVFPGIYLPFVLSRKRKTKGETCPTGREMIVAGWAGMRGTVTLAAALSIPLTLPDGAPLPGRDIVIFMAGGVVIVTLILQGTSLEWLIKRLGLREDDTARNEEHLARRTAVEAGLKALRTLELATSDFDETAALRHVVVEYEQRLSELVAEGESQVNARRMRAAEKRFRLAALDAERRAVDALWRDDVITDDIHRPLQQLLDHEEAMLRAHPTHRE